MLKILIAENVPSLNKGEMAIIEGMLECFRDLGTVELSMLSFFPDIDQARYGVSVKVIDIKKSWPVINKLNSGRSIFKSIWVMVQHLLFILAFRILGKNVLRLFQGEVWKEYINADVIIVGHDSNFGIGGDPENPLLYPLYIPFFAKLLNKTTMFYAGSIPKPPQRFRWIFSKAFKIALSKVDVITLRENVSVNNLKEIGLRNNRIVVTADPAFLLKPASDDCINKIITMEGIEHFSKPLIGVTISKVRGLLAFPEINNPELAYDMHLEMMAQFIDKIIIKLNASIIFIPHSIGLGDELDDRITAKKILNKCQNKERIKIIFNEYGPAELKGLIGQFDLLIGERLHSAIAALTMGVPAIAISYSSDQRLGMIRMLGQDNAICYVEGMDCDTLLSKIDYIWPRREKIANELRLQSKDIKQRARLNGVKLKEFLENRSGQ